MSALHIVHGGVENGDKRWLERAARRGLRATGWIAPKTAAPGDEVAIFIIGGSGFFATARVTSVATPRSDWRNRYSVGLDKIRLIEPPISLEAIKQAVPELAWASHPRHITTPSPEVARQIRTLIARRRKSGLPEHFDDQALEASSDDELRSIALLSARPIAVQKIRRVNYRQRSQAIRLYVLRRASGRCEGCKNTAPFRKPDGSAYLEPHHTTRLADDGPDHPTHVIALCPNCHRRAHHANDAKIFNRKLKKTARRLWTKKSRA